VNEDIKVTSCRNACPYFRTEGMEQMMYCGHPYWIGKGYNSIIINQNNSNGRVPDECPLRIEPITRTVRLA